MLGTEVLVFLRYLAAKVLKHRLHGQNTPKVQKYTTAVHLHRSTNWAHKRAWLFYAPKGTLGGK